MNEGGHRVVSALLTLLLAACAGQLPVKPLDAHTREIVLMEALGQIGRPYHWGGDSSDGFDCSGLAQYSYAQAGITLPRTAAEQINAGQRISFNNAQPGDLLFYRINGALHEAIYVGDGQAVHAPAAGQQVVVTSVTIPFWQHAFVTAVRIGAN